MKSELSIGDDTTIKESLKILNRTSSKVLFIVDGQKRLIGALSDGDIRRGILDGRDLTDTIETIYNRNPHYLEEGFSADHAKSTLIENRIEVLPVVDADRRILQVVRWEHLFGEENRRQFGRIDLPVVIMAGGMGTRMAPFTNVLPKPLIPIGDKTILEIIIDEFRQYGINDYYLTLNYRGQMIDAYFNSIEKDYNLVNVWEKEFEGTAGSLKLLPVDSIHDDFILTNCDVIVKADYCDALELHRQSKALVTVLSSIQHYRIPYGVIDFAKDGEVLRLVEKPEYSFTVNTGVYIVNKKAIELIPEGQVFHMTHLMEELITRSMKVVTYPVNENDYIDIGQWDEYRDAIKRMT